MLYASSTYPLNGQILTNFQAEVQIAIKLLQIVYVTAVININQNMVNKLQK